MKQGYSKLRYEDLLEADTSKRIRRHSCKLIKGRSNKDLRRFVFSLRVVNRWNRLGDYSGGIQEQTDRPTGKTQKDGPI
jgi:hypothetical protein